jgi:LysM repeat protein
MKKLKLLSLKSLVPQSKVPKPRKPATRLAARLTQPAFDDYEEEPTTKLSTAFVVVLVLHLVAVGGIYAFHSIKAKRREADGTALTAAAGASKEAAPKVDTVAKPQPAGVSPEQTATIPAPVPKPAQNAQNAKIAAALSMEKAPAGPSAVVPQPLKAPGVGGTTPVATASAGGGGTPAKAAAGVSANGSTAEPSPKTYTVQKGDNPVAIAKRMGVNYEELLRLNGVDNPKRIQIGQVLKLPVRTKANGH